MGQAGVMAISLPLPFRVAAGILGTGIDLVRSLPDDIPALPVTLVGNAIKLSMKVQQEIATLATRGDELLGGVIGGPEENPAWAKFDGDEPVRPVRPVSKLKTAASAGKNQDAAAGRTPDGPHVGKPGTPDSKAKPAETTSGVAKAGPDTHSDAGPVQETRTRSTSRTDQVDEAAPVLTTPEATSMPPTVTTAMDAAIDVADAVIEEALGAVDEPAALQETTLDDAVALEVAAELAEGLQDAAALDVIAEVTEALEEAVALEVAAEVTEALEDAVAQELASEVSEALEDVLSAEVAPIEASADASPIEGAPIEASKIDRSQIDASLIDASLIDASQIDAEDFAENPVVFEETEELTESLPVPPELLEEVAAATGNGHVDQADGPAALPDYDQMTLAQVRGHLRELSSDEVSALLRYEQDGDARPPFLTLLSNRLVTLDAQNQ
jgi:hypothetical protein